MNKTTKKHFKSAFSFVLILTIIITGAFAYLTAQDGKKNVFTIGNIDLELVEEDWVDVDGDGDFEHNDGLNENILPGHKIPKAPYVKNTGSKAAYTYVTVGVPTMQKDPSNPDPLAVSFSNTSIPVVAYGVQEGYGQVTGSENIWNAYYAGNVAEKFGNKVIDEAELLNRVELFELSELGSGWSQLGDVYKSADGFNYYVFAYEGTEPTLAANTETTKVFEYVVLNKAITESKDVLFSPESAAVNYYAKSDIGEDKAEEIYSVDTDYMYSGEINKDYTPKESDGYYVSNADALLTFNSTSDKWEVEVSEANPIDEDLVPKAILNKRTLIVDPQADPDPDHSKPQLGDVYEDKDYVYVYGGFRMGESLDDLNIISYAELFELSDGRVIIPENVTGWSVIVKNREQTAYAPIKHKIWGEPVEAMLATFSECTNLITAPKLSENTVVIQDAFAYCDSLIETPIFPEKIQIMSSAFNRCSNLKIVHPLPSELIIANAAFSDCKELTNFPDLTKAVKLTKIHYMFENCSLLSGTIKFTSPYITDAKALLNGTTLPITIECPISTFDELYNETTKYLDNVTVISY